jgi:hypothetical protein
MYEVTSPGKPSLPSGSTILKMMVLRVYFTTSN